MRAATISGNLRATLTGCFAIFLGLADTAWGADYIEYACKFTQDCQTPGDCEVNHDSEAPPGFFVTERKHDPNRVYFDRVSAKFWIDGGVKDDDDLIFDVGYYSEKHQLQAWFGGKAGRIEMMSITADGKALKTTHYPSQNLIHMSMGTCERLE